MFKSVFFRNIGYTIYVSIYFDCIDLHYRDINVVKIFSEIEIHFFGIIRTVFDGVASFGVIENDVSHQLSYPPIANNDSHLVVTYRI